MSKSVVIKLRDNLRAPKDRVVHFGKQGFAGYAEYTFKPKHADKGRLDAENPHICEVSNQDHIAKFLAITEGYSLYLGDDAEEVPALSADEPPIDDGDQFSNLALLDAETMTDDDLRNFANKVMGISPRAKAAILDWYEDKFDKKLDKASNIADLLRQCAAAVIEREQMLSAGEI